MTTQEMILTLISNPILKAYQTSRANTTVIYSLGIFVDEKTGNQITLNFNSSDWATLNNKTLATFEEAFTAWQDDDKYIECWIGGTLLNRYSPRAKSWGINAGYIKNGTWYILD